MMRTIMLDQEAIDALLASEQVGRLATLDARGCPYITPVSFVWADGRIYVHTSVRGERLANLRADNRVGFEVDRQEALVVTDMPCKTSARYASVIIRGTAAILDDPELKRQALGRLVAKYVPQHLGKDMPESAIRRTTILVVTPLSCTGKQHLEA